MSVSCWKLKVAESSFLELQRFAKGLERGQEAVLAGLTESYSNGMTEGFVNKLKLIKRQEEHLSVSDSDETWFEILLVFPCFFPVY